MNKAEFLSILEKRLLALPSDERTEAIEFYRELIEESPNEEDAIAKLHHPKQLASKLILEFGVKSPKDKKLSILTIILAILSAPFTVPIALILIAFVLIIIILLFCFILMLSSVALVFLTFGITTIVGIPAAFDYNLATGLVMLGTGIFSVSACYSMIMLTVFLTKKIFNGIKAVIIKFVIRRYRNEA